MKFQSNFNKISALFLIKLFLKKRVPINIFFSLVSQLEFEYMIEATDPNNSSNIMGGIFSTSTKYSLMTCPPQGSTPKLVQKFGKWNESAENIGKLIVYFGNKDNTIFITASSDVCCELFYFLSLKFVILIPAWVANNFVTFNRSDILKRPAKL